MKKLNYFLRSLLMCTALFLCVVFIACSSDDGEADMQLEENDAEIFLEFTLDGTDYSVLFDDSNPSFLASSAPGIDFTSLVASGSVIGSDASLTFVAGFTARTTGTYTLEGVFDESSTTDNGLGLIITANNQASSWIAESVTLNVSSYEQPSIVTALVEATFSGTMRNEQTDEIANISNGRLKTGFLDSSN